MCMCVTYRDVREYERHQTEAKAARRRVEAHHIVADRAKRQWRHHSHRQHIARHLRQEVRQWAVVTGIAFAGGRGLEHTHKRSQKASAKMAGAMQEGEDVYRR